MITLTPNEFSDPLICGLEWNLEKENEIDMTWWFSWFDLTSNQWEKTNTTLTLRPGQGQDYSTFYQPFNNGGFYLILNLALGGTFTRVLDPAHLLHEGKPQYMVIESVKTYSFNKPLLKNYSFKKSLQEGKFEKPSRTIYDKIQRILFTNGNFKYMK